MVSRKKIVSRKKLANRFSMRLKMTLMTLMMTTGSMSSNVLGNDNWFSSDDLMTTRRNIWVLYIFGFVVLPALVQFSLNWSALAGDLIVDGCSWCWWWTCLLISSRQDSGKECYEGSWFRASSSSTVSSVCPIVWGICACVRNTCWQALAVQIWLIHLKSRITSVSRA